MTFTKEQMDRLSKWERNFSAVVYGKFLRAVGQTSLGEIVDIYAEATGVRLKARGGCATCIYETLSVVGSAYFDDKAEMEAEAVEEQETAAMPAADESALVIDKYYLEKKTGTRHSSLAAAKKSAENAVVERVWDVAGVVISETVYNYGEQITTVKDADARLEEQVVQIMNVKAEEV